MKNAVTIKEKGGNENGAFCAHCNTKKHKDANVLMFGFEVIKIVRHLVNFYKSGDNASLLDQNCS